MPPANIGFHQMAIALLEAAHRTLKRVTDGLTDEQLYSRPSKDTNSVAWLAWHLGRWKDRFGAMATGEAQVWVSEGWADRFGIAHAWTGLGDSPSKSLRFA